MIRIILFLSLVGLSLNVSVQDYYSKIFDFGQVEASDLFTAMIEKDGYLYLLARYNYIDISKLLCNVVEADNGDLICAGYGLNNLAYLSLLSYSI